MPPRRRAPAPIPLDVEAVRRKLAEGKIVRVGISRSAQFPEGATGRVRQVGNPDVDGEEFVQVELILNGTRDVLPFTPTDLTPATRAKSATGQAADARKVVARAAAKEPAAHRFVDISGEASRTRPSGAGAVPGEPPASLANMPSRAGTLVASATYFVPTSPDPVTAPMAGSSDTMATPGHTPTEPAGTEGSFRKPASTGGATAATTTVGTSRSAPPRSKIAVPASGAAPAAPGPAAVPATAVPATAVPASATAAPAVPAVPATAVPASATAVPATGVPTTAVPASTQPTTARSGGIRGARRPPAISITIATTDTDPTQWRIEARVGARVALRSGSISPARVWELVLGLDDATLTRAVGAILDEQRNAARARAEALTAELARVQAQLAALPDGRA